MNNKCQIFNTIERIRSASYCNIGFVGGSLTAAAGVGDSSVTSWRRLFVRHIYERFHPVYHCQPSEVMGGIGAVESYGAVFTLSRNILPNLPVLVFLEFCVNDRGCPDKALVKKGVEGAIRQIKSCQTHPDVVLLGAGNRPGTDPITGDLVDHSLHRELADYYGLSFIDVQAHLLKTLKERGQTWNDISIAFEKGDNYHLNDYGNYLWFDALRAWFDEQWKLYDLNPAAKPANTLPPPHASDEFQYTSLVDPTKRNKNLTWEGSWAKKTDGCVPWYFDNILTGRPGDKLKLVFSGTAIGMACLVHCNGLKIEAKLDGKDVAGPFTNFPIEFGKFYMLEHGLPNQEHVLELEVDQPMKKHNKLEDPNAQIGYFLVAQGPQKDSQK